MNSNPTIYILRYPELPWGDYGHLLHCGMTVHLGRSNDLLQLERTGPFVPPISIPDDVVVTDRFKKAIEKSGLTGFAFKPVIKKHIVKLEWEKWDKSSEDPPEFPESGEPEDYILERNHSEELAAQIGNIWEFYTDEKALIEREQIEKNDWDMKIHIVASSIPNTDFFGGVDVGYMYLSKNAKLWLEQNFYEYVSFKEANVR